MLKRLRWELIIVTSIVLDSNQHIKIEFRLNLIRLASIVQIDLLNNSNSFPSRPTLLNNEQHFLLIHVF
jgi:hypothetical protein